MPALGADMQAGTVVEWLVGPGDPVHRGDVIAVVDTDKSTIDVECFDTGVVQQLLVPVGQKVPVGTPLAVIGADDTAAAAPAPVLAPPPPATPAFAGGHANSPLTRKRAAQAGLDLATLHGSGPGGAITRNDVEHPTRPARRRVSPYARRLAAARGLDPAALVPTSADGVLHAADLPPAPAAAPTRRDQGRSATAALMAKAKREIPHYYLTTDIDLLAATTWLRTHNRAVPVADRVLPAALLLRAVALAARAVPQLNGHWIDDAFVPGDGVHLGVAISLRGGGLAAPVVRDAHALGLDALMTRVREAGERARAGRLRSSEAAGATITVTNLGEQGVDSVVGVIYPPQVALVGFGAVRSRPWAVDHELSVRPIVTATLAADHRASDGAVGARLLREIDRRLQRPEEL
jgi:pyruvate dehydrogenase E2 component (dihydrolipoyllysine-residue acetyltransferase)